MDTPEDGNDIVYESSSSRIIRCHLNADYAKRFNFNDSTLSTIDTSTHTEHIEVAVKSLIYPRPNHEDLSFLNNEYEILTRHLSGCDSSVRRALGRTAAKKPINEKESPGDNNVKVSQVSETQHAICLEWIEGITLQDLIKQFHNKEWTKKISPCDSDSKTSSPMNHLMLVRLMYGIALALADIHEAGVIHNDISTDNIIVCFGDGGRGRFQGDNVNETTFAPIGTKFIDFGYATTMAVAEANDDLYNLGVIYREILIAASTCADHHDLIRNSLTRGSITRIGDEILPETFPKALRSIVYCLTDCETDLSSSPPYKSATEVAEDLEQMLYDPSSFLYEQYRENSESPTLVFESNKLYGRSEEVKRLMNAYKQMQLASNSSQENSKCPDIIFVSGYGGSGKTTLVESLKDLVVKDGGYYVSGKFDILQRSEPYSALIEALSKLCTAILAGDGDTIEKIRGNIVKAVGSDGMTLTKLIPELNTLMKGSKQENEQHENQSIFSNGINAQNKLNFFFRRFMRAVATYDHPLVMVLDDLHWADAASLNLLQSIVTDSENKSPLLFIGCYRNNELGNNHPLLKTIDYMQRLKYTSSNKKIETITIGSLDREDINVMISDATLTKRRVTRKKVANLVYQKTNGNPLFAIQFLKSLVDESILFFHPELKRWQWNEDGIRLQNVSDDIVEFLAQKIKTRLSENAKRVLRLAACLGSIFEVKTLATVVNATAEGSICGELDKARNESHYSDMALANHDLSNILDELVEEGLLVDIVSISQYKFVHDRVHQAAYECISEAERPTIHHQIGELLWKTSSLSKNSSIADELLQFIMVDQLNKGSALISDESKKVSLARLNLRVGEICIEKTSFQTAITYLEAGIRLLDQENCWKENYNLSLQLHNMMAKVYYSTGSFEEIPKLLDRVFMHARSFDDKLDAYSTQMMVLGAQGKGEESIKVGLNALVMIREQFPASISTRTILVDVTKTKWMLKGKGDASLMKLPLMTDKKKMIAMQFLSTLVLYSATSKPQLFPLLVGRMVRISISHGICEASAFSFGLFGHLLCAKLGDIKLGYKCGQLSLSLAERCGGKKWLAKVYFAVLGGINSWVKEPFLGSLSLLDGYNAGMEVGDLEYANVCASLFLRDSFFSGEFLEVFEKKARKFCYQFAEYNQGLTLTAGVPLWQVTLNLLGKSENPWKLDGEAINFATSLFEIDSSQYNQARFLFFEMYLAYMFGRSELAAEKSEEAQYLFASSSHGNHQRITYSFMFYDGLNNIDMAISTNEKKWEVKARRNMKKIKKIARKVPRLYHHENHLLIAKYAMLKGKKRKASREFEAAMTAASKAGLCNEEALVCELAGVFFQKEGEEERAKQCFANAHQCYLKWGAQAKVDHLKSYWIS